MTQEKPLKAVGAFIFAGGFTLGVREHFNVLAHLEGNGHGVETARHNFPDLPIYVGADNWPRESLADEGVDLVYTNPPCAAWSQANGKSGTHWRGDDRVDCTRLCFTLLRDLRPRVWVWESVRGAFTKGREFVNELAEQAHDLGYAVTFLYLDAAAHGVPQRRRRFMFVAHDVELDFDIDERAGSVTTVRDVMESDAWPDDPGPTEKISQDLLWASLIPRVGPGEQVVRLFDAEFQDHVQAYRSKGLNVPGRPSFQVRRVPLDDVCYTLTGGANKLHPHEDRMLGVREYAAISGYPKDFEFVGSTGYQYKQVAQAVLPPVGEYVARVAAHGIRRGEPAEPGSTRFVDVSTEKRVERYLTGGPVPLDPGGLVGDPGPAAPEPEPEPAELPLAQVWRPKPGTRRVHYLRMLIMAGQLTSAQMLQLIRYFWPESKMTGADVSYHRRKLKDDGYEVPDPLRRPRARLPAYVTEGCVDDATP